MPTRHRRRIVLAAGLGLLAMVSAVPPVAAGEIQSKGKTGDYQVHDANDNSSDAICRYLSSGKLDRITIRAPFIHASSHLSSPTQKHRVGWRVVIERQPSSGGPWSRWYRSGFAKAQATQEQIADLEDRTVDVPSTSHNWRVRTIIRWYKPGTRADIIGSVAYRYDWYYAARYDSTVTGACYGTA